jgi:DNA invertase Pin-like site-specific DNA recombinase
VAEVGLGHVGLVLGVEMSRLARSCRDWHQLLEICALFDTPIADVDGVYDPANYNDRLLLGLKRTMSEAELHILKARISRAATPKPAGANSTSRCQWAICAALQGKWRSTPTSKHKA